jgi:hypothetical protein
MILSQQGHENVIARDSTLNHMGRRQQVPGCTPSYEVSRAPALCTSASEVVQPPSYLLVGGTLP